MATKEQVRDSLISLGEDAESRGDPTTAGVYFCSAIRLGMELIEEMNREVFNYLKSHQRKAS